MFGGEQRLMDADAQQRDRLYQRAQHVGLVLGGGGAAARGWGRAVNPNQPEHQPQLSRRQV